MNIHEPRQIGSDSVTPFSGRTIPVTTAQIMTRPEFGWQTTIRGSFEAKNIATRLETASLDETPGILVEAVSKAISDIGIGPVSVSFSSLIPQLEDTGATHPTPVTAAIHALLGEHLSNLRSSYNPIGRCTEASGVPRLSRTSVRMYLRSSRGPNLGIFLIGAHNRLPIPDLRSFILELEICILEDLVPVIKDKITALQIKQAEEVSQDLNFHEAQLAESEWKFGEYKAGLSLLADQFKRAFEIELGDLSNAASALTPENLPQHLLKRIRKRNACLPPLIDFYGSIFLAHCNSVKELFVTLESRLGVYFTNAYADLPAENPNEVQTSGEADELIKQKARYLKLKERYLEFLSQVQRYIASLELLAHAFRHNFRTPSSAITTAEYLINQSLQSTGTNLSPERTNRHITMMKRNIQVFLTAIDAYHKRFLCLAEGKGNIPVIIEDQNFKPLKDTLTECGIEVIGTIADLKTDPFRLFFILYELIGNARKHGIATQISVTFGYSDPRNKTNIRIEVTDNGRGIPQEILSHIFEERFTTAGGTGGTGWGLYLVDRWVRDDLKGTIEVSSEPEIRTTFTIILPTITQ